MSEDADSANGGAEADDPAAADAPSDEAVEDQPPVDPLEEARAEASRLKDQLLRTAADFDNFRKRSRRETSDAEKKGREDMLRDLLPVFDNLERATAHAESVSDVKSFAQGIAMVMKQFGDTLERGGILRVTSVGMAFDPMVHEAIQQVETDEHPPGTVAAEVQAGYRVGDRLIRPALVVVAKAAVAPTEEPAADSPEPAGADPVD